MMDSDVIQVSDQAREIYGALFARTPSGLLLFAGSAPSIALLPERLRDEFGFGWKSGVRFLAPYSSDLQGPSTVYSFGVMRQSGGNGIAVIL